MLTTGNKSEIAVGYSTLYGDMAGGFAVIKDVPKTLVYELVRARQRARPGATSSRESVFDRAPSAELRPDQTDQDSLPPYDVLDAILEAYVEEDRGVSEIVARGFDADDRATVVIAWSTATSTSAARAPSASRSRRAPSAATGACRSSTASAKRTLTRGRLIDMGAPKWPRIPSTLGAPRETRGAPRNPPTGR